MPAELTVIQREQWLQWLEQRADRATWIRWLWTKAGTRTSLTISPQGAEELAALLESRHD